MDTVVYTGERGVHRHVVLVNGNPLVSNVLWGPMGFAWGSDQRLGSALHLAYALLSDLRHRQPDLMNCRAVIFEMIAIHFRCDVIDQLPPEGWRLTNEDVLAWLDGRFLAPGQTSPPAAPRPRAGAVATPAESSPALDPSRAAAAGPTVPDGAAAPSTRSSGPAAPSPAEALTGCRGLLIAGLIVIASSLAGGLVGWTLASVLLRSLGWGQ